MAHRIEWCSLHEIAMASAEPKLAPAFTTCADRARARVRGGSPSYTGPLCVIRDALPWSAASSHLGLEHDVRLRRAGEHQPHPPLRGLRRETGRRHRRI